MAILTKKKEYKPKTYIAGKSQPVKEEEVDYQHHFVYDNGFKCVRCGVLLEKLKAETLKCRPVKEEGWREAKSELNKVAGIVFTHFFQNRIDEGSDLYAIAKDMIKELDALLQSEIDKARVEVIKKMRNQYADYVDKNMEYHCGEPLIDEFVKDVKRNAKRNFNKIFGSV